MPKYYRVRSQQEWDWLADKLNIYCVKSMACPVIIEHEQGQKDYRIVQYYGGFEPVIEVSQMMEESRMEDYVTIDSGDFDKIKFDRPQEDGNSFVVKKVNVMGYDTGKYVRDVELPTDLLIPKPLLYPKVRMSVAEKKEFDRLKENALSLRFAFDELKSEHGNYPKLCERLFNNTLDVEDSKAQNDFARAWSDESLIEVIPDRKWKVKVPRSDESYYFKDKIDGKAYLITVSVEPKNTNGALFTDEELKQFGLDDNFFEKVEVKDD